jgi:hypothetical protein
MFKSIDTLKQEFGFESTISIDDLTSELKRRRAAIHPDKSDGEFLSEAARLQYSRITEALDFITDVSEQPDTSNPAPLALANRTELSTVIENVARIEKTLEQLRLSNASKNQVKDTLRRDIKRFGRAAQLTSATCAAAFVAMLGFSSKIASIPALASIATSNAGKISVLALLGISAIAFGLTWINEFRLNRILIFLISDRGLANVLFWRVSAGPDQKPKTEMQKSEVVHDICEMGNYWRSWHRIKQLRWLSKLLRVRIPADFADHAAESILGKLLDRGIIFKKGMRSVQPLYGINQQRAEEVLEERHEILCPILWHP